MGNWNWRVLKPILGPFVGIAEKPPYRKLNPEQTMSTKEDNAVDRPMHSRKTSGIKQRLEYRDRSNVIVDFAPCAFKGAAATIESEGKSVALATWSLPLD